jgi:tetratricopeptide (TPR) repeat protein
MNRDQTSGRMSSEYGASRTGSAGLAGQSVHQSAAFPGQGVAADSRWVLALARAQYGQGRYAEAARTIRPLFSRIPNDFDVLSIYGMALKQAGQQPEAADALRKALSIRESATLQRALEEITPIRKPTASSPARQQRRSVTSHRSQTCSVSFARA